jgi:hypothetical protein
VEREGVSTETRKRFKEVRAAFDLHTEARTKSSRRTLVFTVFGPEFSLSFSVLVLGPFITQLTR